MSQNLDAAFIASFEEMVKHAYQAEGHKLRPYVRVKTGVIGSTHRFNKIGKGKGNPRGAPQTPVPPMNVGHSSVTVTLEDFVFPEYTDKFMQAKVPFDEKQELAQAIAMAVGRRDDQWIIDAATASATTNTISADIGGANTNMNFEKVRQAKRMLDVKGVPEEGRVMVVHPTQIESILAEPEATSADFAAGTELRDGKITRWLGFQWVQIPEMEEGGLPLAGGDRTCFAWHKNAIGLAEGIAPTITIDWVPTHVSHLINACASANAVAIDDVGIVKISCDDDAGPTI